MANKSQIQLPRTVPSSEEATKLIEECLRTAGVDPDAFEILVGTNCLVAPQLDGDAKYMPCHMAISKANGMAFLFPALGPHGINQRYVDSLRKPN